MKNRISENRKVTLTIGQLKRLVLESIWNDDFLVEDGGDGGDVSNDSELTVKYGTDPIQCSCKTITKDGMGVNEFQIDMNNLEKWLKSIEARETYNDIKEDILDGMETFIHLTNPITGISLTMPKPKI